ncbi:MAG TPA: FKBP-type peptidyl-prolyl cis-trans isomerase [Nocardioidaceae bacterium]|nr:FKBP-type peptidyl-prolyl cis-trans isomerase [Nocardioidaceae bacterium]
MRRRLVALTIVPLLLFGSAACGEDPDSGSSASESPSVDMGEKIPGVTVEGEFGKEPEVTIDGALDNTDTQEQVITAGDGTKVEEGMPASLHIQVYNGKSGEKSVGTYEQGTPLTGTMAEGQIFPAVLDAVVGLPVGSRVAVAATPEDAFGPQGAQQYGIGADENVLFVVDVMSVPLTAPEGEKADLPEDLPTIKEDGEGNVTKFTFENAPEKPSDELQVIPVIEGEGEPVKAGDSVTFDYLGQIYGTDTIFDQSYTDAPRTFTVGTGNLIKGWDEGLVGVKAGSRVMIIAPPEYGYGESGNPQAKIKGTDTLVFVVDVLGVS